MFPLFPPRAPPYSRVRVEVIQRVLKGLPLFMNNVTPFYCEERKLSHVSSVLVQKKRKKYICIWYLQLSLTVAANKSLTPCINAQCKVMHHYFAIKSYWLFFVWLSLHCTSIIFTMIVCILIKNNKICKIIDKGKQWEILHGYVCPNCSVISCHW